MSHLDEGAPYPPDVPVHATGCLSGVTGRCSPFCARAKVTDYDVPPGRPDIPGNRSIEVEPSPGTYSYNGPPEFDYSAHGREVPADMPDGGTVRGSGGWCMPSDVLKLPEVTVKRGGLRWGASTHESDCAKLLGSGPCDCGTPEEFEQGSESDEYETASEAATRQRWMTVRLFLILSWLLVIVLAFRDSLPW